MLHTVFSDGCRAAHETTDMHPAVNGILSNSIQGHYDLISSVNNWYSWCETIVVIWVMRYNYISVILMDPVFYFRFVCLWEAKWQHGEGPQRLCHGDRNRWWGNGGDPVSPRAFCCVHKPLLPQKLWYRTQVSLKESFLVSYPQFFKGVFSSLCFESLLNRHN